MNPKLKLSAAALVALALALVPQAAQAGQDPPTPSEAKSAVTSAQGALAAYAPSLRTAQDDAYHLQANTPGANGLQFLTYSRTHKGLPVYGGEVVVTTDASGQSVSDITTGQQAVINVGTKAKVSAATAAATSQARIKKVDSVSAPSLVVHAASKTPRLAYATTVTGPSNNRTVYVDALTGAVIDEVELFKAAEGRSHYVGTVTIDTQATSMVDPNRRGIQCGGQNGSAFTGSSPWGNGGATDLPTACVDVLYGVQKEWDMLREWVGRNGINGSGGGFPARVGLAQANAFWNGSYTNYGHNGASGAARKNLVSMDVVGHEYGHAIFQTTPGGAGSGNEAGGLNESTGDIFGAVTEHYANNPNDPPDYLVGEEPALGGGPIRNMYNPSALGHPNCYTPGSFPEVHAGAGPQNHWFYLMSEGTNPQGKPASTRCDNGPAIVGIGIRKAAQVFMTTLNKKTSPWTHTKVRVAALQAAKELWPGSCAEFNVVKAAFDGIRLGAQSGEPTCTAPTDDFSLSLDPAAGQADPGDSVTTTVRTTVTSGNAQQITLRAGTLPSGVTAQFNPATITAGQTSTLTLSTSAGSPVGGHAVQVTADGTAVDKNATYNLTIGQVQDDFSFAVSPASGSTQPGGSAQTTINTTVTSGSAQQVALSASGQPSGVTVTFSPATVTAGQSSQVTVATTSSVAAGSYPITLTGAGTSGSKTATYTLTVGSTGTEWAPYTSYTVGQVVTYQGASYRCRQSHTSLPGWEPPNVLALWQPL
ncbi:M4 family metallopeptidase [Nonomuraea sp. NPDC059007]|uniref:M4 family metallopeptidase n=1 Tax=Nonomuraea sp. NPDC059007 TaxID=3346692 RepID=UPI00368B0016